MTSLIQLYQDENQLIATSVNAILENGGEIPDELAKALAVIETKKPEKIDSYASILERIENEIQLLESREKALAQLKKSFSKLHERLKTNLKFAAELSGLSELSGNAYAITISKTSGKLVISDERKIPHQFIIYERKLKNDEIKEALQRGENVPGAEILNSYSLRIRPKNSLK